VLLPPAFDTTTVYSPASVTCTAEMLNVAMLTPLMGTVFLRH